MQSTISLREYYLRYPDTASAPTITQTGLLAYLLARQRYRAAKLAYRCARWNQRREVLRHAFVHGWKILMKSMAMQTLRPAISVFHRGYPPNPG